MSEPNLSSSTSINTDNPLIPTSKRVTESQIFMFNEEEFEGMDSDEAENYHTTWSDEENAHSAEIEVKELS